MIGRITATVDSVVLSRESEIANGNCQGGDENDNAEVMSREGVVFLLLRGKLHAETNQIRKAWLCIRRACLVGRIIASNELEMQGEKETEKREDWRTLFDGIMETDRFFSMFLGMPHVPDDRLDDDNYQYQIPEQIMDPPSSVDEKMRYFRRIAAIACGKINDRNTTSSDKNGFASFIRATASSSVL